MEQTLGRPRHTDIDQALVTAVEALLLEGGFQTLSIQAVVERAKTTRPSFYRRYKGIPELLLDMLRFRFGSTLLAPDSGSLDGDLLWIQRDQVALFSHPMVQHSLAGFLDALRGNAELRAVFVDEFFQPRRTATKDVIGRAVLRGEIATPRDLEWVCDKLTGPIAMRALFPSLGPIDDELARVTADDAARGLREESSTQIVR